MALAYFKLAIIAAGIDYRARMGGSDDAPDNVGEAVAPLIAAGISTLKAPDGRMAVAASSQVSRRCRDWHDRLHEARSGRGA